MAQKWKIWIEPSGVRQVLQSEEVRAELLRIGNKIAARAGEGYEASVSNRGTRAVAKVSAVTPKAYYSNLKNNTLLKALGGGE